MLERLLRDPNFGVKCEFDWQTYKVVEWFESHGFEYAYGNKNDHWINPIVCACTNHGRQICVPWVIEEDNLDYITYQEFEDLLNDTYCAIPFPEELI